MTEKEVGELYIRLAFQYESAISRLLDKKIIDQDLVDRHRKSFYDSLDEEKLRAAQKIGDGFIDRTGKAIFSGFPWVYHSKLDA